MYVQFINIRVEDAVHEADAWALVRILVRELDVDFPKSTLERCLKRVSSITMGWSKVHTLFGTLEPDVELLPGYGQRKGRTTRLYNDGWETDTAETGQSRIDANVGSIIGCLGIEERTVVINQSHLIVTHQPGGDQYGHSRAESLFGIV